MSRDPDVTATTAPTMPLADAALIARALPGVPVRVQWMREQGACLGTVRSRDGDQTEGLARRQRRHRRLVISRSGATPIRCGRAAPDLAAGGPADGRNRFALPAPRPLPLPEGGGDRNAIPIYKFPNAKVVHHFIPEMPLRISAMRALGAYHNVFSIESFMDLSRGRGRRRSR